jgi:hypothetical protein
VEFVVVVVLEDREAVRLGELRQARPPRDRHDGAGRELVMRRQEHGAEALAREQRFERRDIESVPVDRHRHETRAGQAQHAPRRREAERFDRHRVAGPEQQASHQVDGLLDAARHHQVLRAHREPARARKHGGQLRAKTHVSRGVGVAEQGPRALADRTAERARQGARRKQPGVGQAEREHQHAGRALTPIGTGHEGSSNSNVARRRGTAERARPGQAAIGTAT